MIQDYLTLGFDFTNHKDRTCLMVSRPTEERNFIINTFFDEQAEDLYTILVGNEDWRNE